MRFQLACLLFIASLPESRVAFPAEPAFRVESNLTAAAAKVDITPTPDAKVVDDGSCPQGRVKRIPRDPRLALCIDRKRLKVN